MKRSSSARRIASVASATLAMVLAVSPPGYAEGVRGHGFGGGGAMEHHGFVGHHFDGHDGHHSPGRDFDRRHFEERRFGFGPVLPYYYYYYEPYEVAPSYWYYCPSYEAYYQIGRASCRERV